MRSEELGVSFVKMMLSHKLKQDEYGILISQCSKCPDIKSSNLSHWNMSRIIYITGDFFLKYFWTTALFPKVIWKRKAFC